MAERLSKVARNLNVGINTLVEFLHKKGITVEANPNTMKISKGCTGRMINGKQLPSKGTK